MEKDSRLEDDMTPAKVVQVVNSSGKHRTTKLQHPSTVMYEQPQK